MKQVACVMIGLALFVGAGFARERKDTTTRQDVVYGEDEVDVRAAPKNTRKAVIVVSGSGIRFTAECGVTGTAKLEFVIASTGKVTSARVLSPSGCKNFDKAAVKRTLKTEYIPAIKDGVAVAQRSIVTTRYERAGNNQ